MLNLKKIERSLPVEHHEMAEKLVEKCGITYEEAGEVLKEAGFDLLEAMIILERRGKLGGAKNNKYSTNLQPDYYVYSEKTAADAENIKEFFSLAWQKLCEIFRDILKYQVVISKNGEDILAFPLLLAIILLCCTVGLCFLVVLITLFNGCSYSIRKNI